MGDLAQVVALAAVDPIELPNGSWSRMLVTDRNVGGNRGSLGYSVFTPGTTLAPVRHETEEFAYVVSGRGELLLDDRALPFGPGDALALDVDPALLAAGTDVAEREICVALGREDARRPGNLLPQRLLDHRQRRRSVGG